jgi:hypothetical protein
MVSGPFKCSLSQQENFPGMAFTGPIIIGSFSQSSVYLGGIGSENTNKGRARFTYEFLMTSTFFPYFESINKVKKNGIPQWI